MIYISKIKVTINVLQLYLTGAVSEGLPPVSHGMFPNGGVELINFFYMEKNAELGRILSQQIEKAKQDGLG